jgi:suppressor of ftsI
MIGDKKVTTRVYNGSYVLPTLRIHPGDIIRLRLENFIDQMTSLHFHGMNVTPISPSDDIFIMVTPTGTFNYEIPIPRDHASGLDFYHPHLYGLTEFQIMSGMAGAIIVEGLLYPFLKLQGIRELTMELKDIQIDPNGRVPMEMDVDESSSPTIPTVNGLVNPVIKIHPGETQLWRIVNMGPDRYYLLKLDGHTFFEIARDGKCLNQIVPENEILLPPSSRVEALIQGGPAGVFYGFKTLLFNIGPEGDTYAGAMLATLLSDGPAEKPIPLPTKSEFPPLEDLCDPSEPIAQKRTIVFSDGSDDSTFFINGKTFDPSRVDTQVKIGTLEEWTLQNTSKELHVFHIHQAYFQVCEINGVKQPFTGYQDTVNMPYLDEDPNKQGPGEVKIVINFRDPTIEGKFVYHCHIGEHEDHGMMAVIQAVK